MTDEQALLELDTPQGLLLYGEVGGGKSMLMDILASSLPYEKKQRYHFNAFMLMIYAELEKHRRSTGLHDTYSLLYIAREIVSKSTILFLDEFQFPDRATSMILKHLLSYFFRLGGILVATSNRLPENLLNDWMKGEMSGFQEVLRRRCEVWDMRSSVDWRRHGITGKATTIPVPKDYTLPGEVIPKEVVVPQHYYFNGSFNDQEWAEAVETTSAGPEELWQSSSLTVYSRAVPIPAHRNGCAIFAFHELCSDEKRLGPADFLSITSAYPVLIIHSVPILTARSHRHDARRFITLLDAVYESRCRVLLRAETPIEDLFFPDAVDEDLSSDSIHSEAFSETYQDLTAPFRPNISSYRTGSEELDSLSDLKTNSRRTPIDVDSDFNGKNDKVDFTYLGKYHGEDEKFAFKRAVSRLWEVCGERWWSKRLEQDFGTAHLPLPIDARSWERSLTEISAQSIMPETNPHTSDLMGKEFVGVSTEIEDAPSGDDLARHNDVIVAKTKDGPPRFPPQHIWGVTKWGKKAGKWGQGSDAYGEDKSS